jgi:hypothetical protein
MSSANPTPWAVICPQHGRVYLTNDEYRVQLDRPNAGWECTEVVTGTAPVGPCGEESEWDDENYEARGGV